MTEWAVEILENPTVTEFGKMFGRGESLKGLYDPTTKTKYVWRAWDALHDEVAKHFGVRDPVRMNAVKSHKELEWYD